MSKEGLTIKETLQLRGRTGRIDLFLNEYDVAIADGYKRDRVRIAGTMIICDMYRERSDGISTDEIIVDELKEDSKESSTAEQQVAETPKTTTRKTTAKK